MPYYALMATLGSLGGCVFLYFLARKGGEIAFRKHAGVRAEPIRAWVQRNGFLAVFAVALMPPPVPLKPFVVAAGVFQEPLKSFVLALLLARSLRYFGEGFLAVRYGPDAIRYLAGHRVTVGLVAVALVLAGYLFSRVILPPSHPKS